LHSEPAKNDARRARALTTTRFITRKNENAKLRDVSRHVLARIIIIVANAHATAPSLDAAESRAFASSTHTNVVVFIVARIDTATQTYVFKLVVARIDAGLVATHDAAACAQQQHARGRHARSRVDVAPPHRLVVVVDVVSCELASPLVVVVSLSVAVRQSRALAVRQSRALAFRQSRALAPQLRRLALVVDVALVFARRLLLQSSASARSLATRVRRRSRTRGVVAPVAGGALDAAPTRRGARRL
jgi:hypothetical protein